ncbi:MAG: diacylglycerol kinase family protein [Patescibacteria group bacterium]|nr:diacylglycerol kinase family protein [Patescibacteria group bacterium]
MGIKHSTIKSFGYALEGIKTAMKNEPNFRIHLAIALIILSAGFFFNLSAIEWIILAFTIFYVITMELLNTVIEAVVDLISPKYNPQAKIAKDVAAAGVLVASILSVIVGLILFTPKIANLVR